MLKRKFVALAVSVAMVFTVLSTGAAFAESETPAGEELTGNVQSVEVPSDALESGTEALLQGEIASGGSTLQAPDINRVKNPVMTSDNTATVIVPTQAVLIMYYTGGTPEVKRGDAALTVRDYASQTVSGTKVYIRTYQVSKGSYTAKRSYGNGVMGFQYAPATGATLANNKAYIAGSYNDGQTLFYRVQASANGTIRVSTRGELSDYSMYKVKLFNAAKKPLSRGWETLYRSDNYSTVYGVRKGTYYVGIIPYGSSHSSVYDVAAKFTKRPIDAAGASKKKAKKIKQGQTKRGMVFIGENKVYWYKLKLKKKKTVRIVTGGEFGEGGDRYGTLRYEMIYKAGKVKYLSKDRYQLKKGKYYFKIYKTGNANGYYTFKVQ
ncbi:hypothetical protein [Eubacterium sp. AB3007]|uniref:hypothetical protein n=1 Tax=Eubacterium sp. AB3007 TaxID=1392487 RepID=UPI00163A2164|nr:hypothetical protein [Eubacterium sp. AB3007]